MIQRWRKNVFWKRWKAEFPVVYSHILNLVSDKFHLLFPPSSWKPIHIWEKQLKTTWLLYHQQNYYQRLSSNAKFHLKPDLKKMSIDRGLNRTSCWGVNTKQNLSYTIHITSEESEQKSASSAVKQVALGWVSLQEADHGTSEYFR